MSDAETFRRGLRAFHAGGRFAEEHLQALKRCLLPVVRGGAAKDVLDGLVGLFFERQLLDPKRRAGLIELPGPELLAALRHRFRQLLADAQDDAVPLHALAAHVRQALSALGRPGASAEWPASIQEGGRFSAPLVEKAVAALWAEQGAKPGTQQAARELFRRYVAPSAPPASRSDVRALPDVLRARLDAQRLAQGVLEVLNHQEKALLQHLLEEEGSVEDWASKSKVSRATAYRLMARLKTLAQVESFGRSTRTRLEVLEALRQGLGSKEPFVPPRPSAPR